MSGGGAAAAYASPFAPIAIVGQGCVLPGAFDPAAMWAQLVPGRCLIAPIPDGRWRADRRRLVITPAEREAGRAGCLTDRGGWVTGFDDIFDPAGLLIEPSLLRRLDPLVAWLLHAGRQALAQAGIAPGAPSLSRAGAIFGHLAYPSTGLALFAESCWLGRAERPHPWNRFNAGLPADLLCRGLGLGAGGCTIDAACASSLYAVHMACHRLQAGEADLMLAGGISRIDPLVLHAGFTALGAISPSGRSRPFHAEADGLLPAEGCALVALKRHADAVAAGDPILAVILAVGLANDGSSGGLLAPSAAGQARAMTAAFGAAGREPAEVSLIECHATGTLLGDATEIDSLGRVYTGRAAWPVGSLKSNWGHLTTASGAAALLKIVLALRHGVRPPSLGCDVLAERIAASRFRPLRAAEAWPADTPRLAAISGFGFGGANAHLLLAEPSAVAETPRPARGARQALPAVAVVALGVRVADGAGLADFRQALFAGQARGPATRIGFRPGELRVPPRDLERALPQHLLLLRAALDAAAALGRLPHRTGVFVGAQTDAEACRFGLHLRLPELLAEGAAEAAGARVAPHAMDAAGIIGAMPNILANRINAQFDLHGPGFTIAAEELSGLRALEAAARALAGGEVDAALAGAVDLSVEPVHQAARDAVAPGAARSGDGAVVLVLKRPADAERDGDSVLALVAPQADTAGASLDWTPHGQRVVGIFGHVHAAIGLIQVVAAIVAVQEGMLPPERVGAPPAPWPPGLPKALHLTQTGLGGQAMTLGIIAAAGATGAVGASWIGRS